MRTAAFKSVSFGIRFTPVLREELDQAAKASGMSSPEALRLVAEALVACFRKHGRIPRDMEIRQAVLEPQVVPIKEAV